VFLRNKASVLILFVLLMMFGTSRLLDSIAEEVNELENRREWQATQALVLSMQKRVSDIVADNAYWDEAVARSYGTVDIDWINETWGYYTNGPVYDAVFLLSPSGQTLAAFVGGKQVQLEATAYYGRTINDIIMRMPPDNHTFSVLSSLTVANDELVAISAGTIVPTEQQKAIPQKRPNLLVMSRRLDPPLIKETGATYGVDNLFFEKAQPADFTSANRFKSISGETVALAKWTSRKPGDAARQSRVFGAFLTVIALLTAMVPLSLYQFFTLRKLENKEAAAAQDARTDPLSNLANRTLLIEKIEELNSSETNKETALSLIDLDGFKAVNDTYNHQTGDQLIQIFSRGIEYIAQQKAAGNALVARLGGDEFAVLTWGEDASQNGQEIARNILAFVQEPFQIDDKVARIGASIGLVTCKQPAATSNELIRQADLSMYKAKSSGKNTICVYEPSIDVKRLDNLTIADELRGHLENGLIEVVYQPVVSARSKSIVGVEALVRWPKSSPRHVPAQRMIAIAEETGLIDKITNFVMTKACKDLLFHDSLVLAVNISPVQLNNTKIADHVKAVAAKTGFPLSRLELEFTETVLIKNAAAAKKATEALRALGVRIVLDDFGKGYASVGYLQEYQFDKVKLDKSLVRNFNSDISNQHVVHGTVLIAKGISAEVTAEGIESEEDAIIMHLAGCSTLQGYHFGMPQGIESIKSLCAVADVNKDVAA
jgi:diguanylate cyclase (GGDEF)-like protein